MGIWKASLTIRIRPDLRTKMVEFAEAEHTRTDANSEASRKRCLSGLGSNSKKELCRKAERPMGVLGTRSK